MTKSEKRRFVRELVRSVQTDILANVESMPDKWDGIELRWYIADKFRDSASCGETYRSRLHDYRNTVIVNNL